MEKPIKILKIHIHFEPAVLLLGIHHKNKTTHSQEYVSKNICVTAHFYMSRTFHNKMPFDSKSLE
jgi:uncharacterized protein (UPF0128 family)